MVSQQLVGDKLHFNVNIEDLYYTPSTDKLDEILREKSHRMFFLKFEHTF